MPKANLADIEIYYEVQGEGEPVLCAPASWWPSDTWNVTVVPFLSKRFRTIIFDCRGTGRSSKPKEGFTVAQFAQDCIGLLGHLGISRCHAVGFASAGRSCKRWPSRPDRWRRRSPSPRQGRERKRLSGGRRNVSADTEKEIHNMGFERYIRAYIENDTMAFNPKFYRDHADVVMALADAVWSGQSTVEVFRRHEDARLTWDTLAKAGEVRVPALILCGADDDVSRRGSTPVGTARRLAELMPGCELFLIPNVKHMTFWDGTGGITALQDFLLRHPLGVSQ